MNVAPRIFPHHIGRRLPNKLKKTTCCSTFKQFCENASYHEHTSPSNMTCKQFAKTPRFPLSMIPNQISIFHVLSHCAGRRARTGRDLISRLPQSHVPVEHHWAAALCFVQRFGCCAEGRAAAWDAICHQQIQYQAQQRERTFKHDEPVWPYPTLYSL